MNRLRAVLVGMVAAVVMLGVSAGAASAWVPATWSSYGSTLLTSSSFTISVGSANYVCPQATAMAFQGSTTQVPTGAKFFGQSGSLRWCRNPVTNYQLVAAIALEIIGQKDGSVYSVDGAISGQIHPPMETPWLSTSTPQLGTSVRFRSDWVNGSPSTVTFDNELFGTTPSGKELRVTGVIPTSLTLL